MGRGGRLRRVEEDGSSWRTIASRVLFSRARSRLPGLVVGSGLGRSHRSGSAIGDADPAPDVLR